MTDRFTIIWPVEAPPGSILTSDFANHVRIAKQNDYCYEPKAAAQCPKGYYYGGLDLVTDPAIGGEVRAAADSAAHIEVQDQGEKGYGLNVRITHRDGFYSIYAHLSGVMVKSGDDVKRGHIIGYTGWSGNVWDSNGQRTPQAAHLHFELRWNGKPLDPMLFLFEGAVVWPVEGMEWQVVTDYVNKRSEPSTIGGSQTVIGRIEKGQLVKPSRMVVREAWLDLGDGFCALVYQGNIYLRKR